MSKETTATTLTDTAVVTDLQASNKKLREQLQQRANDDEHVMRFIDDILLPRLDDLRNLLTILPSVKDSNIHASVVSSMHTILDEVGTDVELIYQNGIDELQERYNSDFDKLLRGGEII